ncbi:MAG: hypothetical protein HYZ00_13680 [Candidatus Hydrogenedentes bacterium]|nr:hypothetical protein [Candidatus Hydrogenedentota bacterium]
MVTVKARIARSSGETALLPLAIPDLAEVEGFAKHLHALGRAWKGEIFGWPAEYTPERRKKPAGSKMPFTPADFRIGESGIWFYSMMWEKGLNGDGNRLMIGDMFFDIHH